MLMCEGGYVDLTRGYHESQSQRYLAGSDSDSGYGDYWAYTTGGDDDVFTEREVVLSYDGCEVDESHTEDLVDELSVIEDDVNININEINCTDSFLRWLDSEQDLGSPEYCGESDDSDHLTEYSQVSSISSVDYADDDTREMETRSLPPIQTMVPAGSRMIHTFPTDSYPTRDSFNDLIRRSATTLHVDVTVDEEPENRGGYGHLLCKATDNEENSYTSYFTTYPENQVMIQQSKGEFVEKLQQGGTVVGQRGSGFQPQTDMCLLECRWEDCWSVFVGQAALVRHIEKTHVELRRSDEFACLWQDCPRRSRPFNARYKLLIHMRVHSGEKPNKCPFPGCLKAFSRLENLKIHQRSHTGERPYCCQFPSCAKAFSNSSDRAKHQRTHYDTKPYACQVAGCRKRYTDPSSLRKHIKNHTGVGAVISKTKKLIASEPLVTISSMEKLHRERFNSYVSEATSDYQEEEYNRCDLVEGMTDTEVVGVDESTETFDSSRLIDLDSLGDEIDSQFFENTEFDSSSFLTFEDDEMLSFLCK